MRNFLVEFEEDLFAHDLGEHEPLGLVRDDILLEDLSPLGQAGYDHAEEFFEILPPARGNGHHVYAQFAALKQCFRHPFRGHDVDLRKHQDEGDLRPHKALCRR